MKLTLGFSPCPNDCFIFDAIINKRIDLRGIDFEFHLDDVETLNRAAFKGEIDITKLSYHAYAYCVNNYVLLDSGSALGRNCGPLLISKREIPKKEVAQGGVSIAIPGKYTTANFLLGVAFPKATNKKEMLFSSIEDAVLIGDVDAGLIIHENRFTYEAKGLKKIIDLGEYWETTTGKHIPLGGIVMHRKYPDELIRSVSDLIAESVRYAFAHPKDSLPFVREHAQEMNEEVMYKHIDFYVNEYSIELGKEGRSAVEELFTTAQRLGVIPSTEREIFLKK